MFYWYPSFFLWLSFSLSYLLLSFFKFLFQAHHVLPTIYFFLKNPPRSFIISILFPPSSHFLTFFSPFLNFFSKPNRHTFFPLSIFSRKIPLDLLSFEYYFPPHLNHQFLFIFQFFHPSFLSSHPSILLTQHWEKSRSFTPKWKANINFLDEKLTTQMIYSTVIAFSDMTANCVYLI